MRSFPSDLSAKVQQSLQTLANNSQPKLKIAISRAKTTISDSDYWTVETIREGEGLGNISVAPRRFYKNYGVPDRLYEIHVANGQISTALREYPDKLKQGWLPQFTLGPSNTPGSVAIAFDGHWEKYRGTWRLITTEKPWISWVDNAGILWTQLWDNESSRVQLASDVKFVRMLRGWKNSVIQQNDQGIVTAYIKNDGKVYYRGYCQQENYSYVWENETALAEFTTTATSLNLFLTNDYRMGFVVEDNTGNIHWLVTNRNWGGMASPSDHLTTAINLTFEVIPVTYHDAMEDEYLMTGITDIFFNVAEPIYPSPVSISNDDEYIIRVLFNHNIDADLSTVKNAFKIKDSMNMDFVIVSTEAGASNAELIFNMANINAASGELFVTYDRTIMELDCLNQGSRFAIESFILNFMPELIPPEAFSTEKLNAGITNITFDNIRVYYKDRFEVEHLTAGIANTTFIITKVGNNPL